MPPSDFLQNDWTRAEHVTSRDVTGGAILLDLSNGRCWQINTTGASLWRLLGAGSSIRDAIEEVARPFGEMRDRVEADMRKFAEQLVEAGVLIRRPPDGVSGR